MCTAIFLDLLTGARLANPPQASLGPETSLWSWLPPRFLPCSTNPRHHQPMLPIYSQSPTKRIIPQQFIPVFLRLCVPWTRWPRNFTNATNPQLHHVPCVSDYNDLVNLQTYPSPDSMRLAWATLSWPVSMARSLTPLTNTRLTLSRPTSIIEVDRNNQDLARMSWEGRKFGETWFSIPLGGGIENGLMLHS